MFLVKDEQERRRERENRLFGVVCLCRFLFVSCFHQICLSTWTWWFNGRHSFKLASFPCHASPKIFRRWGVSAYGCDATTVTSTRSKQLIQTLIQDWTLLRTSVSCVTFFWTQRHANTIFKAFHPLQVWFVKLEFESFRTLFIDFFPVPVSDTFQVTVTLKR